jgi:S1-C subfamily serine protease
MRIKVVSLTLLAVVGMLVLSACGTVQAVTGLLEEAPTRALAATAESLVAIPAQGLPPVEGSADFLAAYQGTLENLYKAVNPSVVNIRVVQKVDASDALGQLQQFPFFNLPEGQEAPEQYQSGLGSGFVWDENGHIVTNNHVVRGADKIEVTFSDGSIVSAELVGMIGQRPGSPESGAA